MLGLKSIQVTASLMFDDGYIVSFATPAYQKDIRNGEFFTDEQAQEVLASTGIDFAKIIDEETLKALHKKAIADVYAKQKRHPRFDDGFSMN